jgi:hypothetical protein
MSGKVKKILAILAALGITAGTATTFLTNVMHTFPSNRAVVGACAAIVWIIGMLVAYHPVSIKDPNAKDQNSTTAKLSSLLPFLLLTTLLSSGCHGYKAPTYATLALMDSGATAAAQATPPACELLENAAVDAAKAKDEANAKSGAIHDRCSATLTVLEGIGKGVKTTRNSVHDAPDAQLPPDVLSWIVLLAKQYCDAVPMLAFFHVTLPTIPGVC